MNVNVMQVVGIDPDKERLEFAKEKYHTTNLEFLKGDGTNIPGREYDMVYSNYVIQWCKDKGLVFKHVADCLKKGGHFGFVLPVVDSDAGDRFGFVTPDAVPTPKNLISPECHQHLESTLHLQSTRKVLHLISNNDFSVMQFEKKCHTWMFADINELIKFYMMHTRGLFDNTHFNIGAMIKHYGENEIVLKLHCLIVIAEKK